MGRVLELQLRHQSFQWIFRINFLYDWLVWCPWCQRDIQEFLLHHSSKASILRCLAFLNKVQFSHPYMTTRKTTALTVQTVVCKVMSLLFNMLSRFVIAFLPRNKCLLILRLQSPFTVILKPKKWSLSLIPIVFLSVCQEVMGLDAMILVFWMLSFKTAFSLSSFTFFKRLFGSSSLSAIRMVLSVYLRLLIFLPAILIPACALSSLAFSMMYSA